LNKGFIFLAFSMGAAIGSVVAWKITKTKYERIANEEIESMREHYLSKNKDIKEEESEEPVEEEPQQPDDSERKIYRNITKVYNPDEDKEYKRGPYVIRPEEFDTLDDYEIQSLTYWADEVLTDDDGVVIEDVEGLVGYDSLNSFGEYEDDSVFVRNEKHKIDYEILLDVRPWYEYQKTRMKK
jgi:hypothetical protein